MWKQRALKHRAKMARWQPLYHKRIASVFSRGHTDVDSALQAQTGLRCVLGPELALRAGAP